VGAAVQSRVTALFAILSAILAGGADFLGGVASRKAVGIRVAVFAQAAGLPFAFPLAIVYGFDRLTGSDVAWSAASGVAVGYGFACFYTAMGRGLISVVAPVAAVTGAVMPVVYALVRGERPGALALVGIVIALIAVSVVSIAPSDPTQAQVAVTPSLIGLSMLAGSGFGLFYICFSRVSDDAGMWPVAIERTAATATLVVVALSLTRGPVEGTRGVAPFAVGAGALEVAASVPLLLALQRGPVAVAAVLSSLYPVITVLLAGTLLRERMSRLQLAGVGCALAAIVLVSAG
jgi:drug/metabolite transporter (DMT)-like permease